MKTPPSANRYNPGIFPPWQHGANNDAIKRGLEFTVPEVDNLADFHGDPRDPKLSLYVAGNSFFAMAALVRTSSWGIGSTEVDSTGKRFRRDYWSYRFNRAVPLPVGT